MAVGYIRPAGGLSAADRAALVPDNIRAGVTIFGVAGNIVPFTVPSDRVVGLFCFSDNNLYGCSTPYFIWASNALICTIPCRIQITFSGRTNGGNNDTGYGLVYLNGAAIINCQDNGWIIGGTVVKTLNVGDKITAGFAGAVGNDRKHFRVSLVLQ